MLGFEGIDRVESPATGARAILLSVKAESSRRQHVEATLLLCHPCAFVAGCMVKAKLAITFSDWGAQAAEAGNTASELAHPAIESQSSY